MSTEETSEIETIDDNKCEKVDCESCEQSSKKDQLLEKLKVEHRQLSESLEKSNQQLNALREALLKTEGAISVLQQLG